MTVAEYLKKLNGASENTKITPEMCSKNEILDIFPTSENAIMAGACIFDIISEKIIAKRYFLLRDGSKTCGVKETSLNDDISLHCGKYGEPRRIIEETIRLLREKQESDLRITKVTGETPTDYESRIIAFEDALSLMPKR